MNAIHVILDPKNLADKGRAQKLRRMALRRNQSLGEVCEGLLLEKVDGLIGEDHDSDSKAESVGEEETDTAVA